MHAYDGSEWRRTRDKYCPFCRAEGRGDVQQWCCEIHKWVSSRWLYGGKVGWKPSVAKLLAEFPERLLTVLAQKNGQPTRADRRDGWTEWWGEVPVGTATEPVVWLEPDADTIRNLGPRRAFLVRERELRQKGPMNAVHVLVFGHLEPEARKTFGPGVDIITR